MNKKKLEEFLEGHGWSIGAAKALELAELVLMFLTAELKEVEPMAKRTIVELDSARDTVALAQDEIEVPIRDMDGELCFPVKEGGE
jgi:hypothetical protein